MHLREFLRAGNGKVLFSAFLYFDVSFMVWVLLGALGSFIAEDLGLSAAQKGLVTAIPLLAGSGFRLVLGPLSDHIGSRPAGAVSRALPRRRLAACRARRSAEDLRPARGRGGPDRPRIDPSR